MCARPSPAGPARAWCRRRRPIMGSRGRAGAGLLAHIMVSKFDDHLPLHRQAEIYARGGVELNTSTLSGWVGATAAALAPLIDAPQRDVMASAALHGDDTPVAVLAPGSGRTKTGRFWVYVRDERPHRGKRPPAAVFFYSPDRTAERPLAHLKDFTGVLHADGYAGFKGLYESGRKPGPIVEAACWAHARRKFHDVHAADGSEIAHQALSPDLKSSWTSWPSRAIASASDLLNGMAAHSTRTKSTSRPSPLASANLPSAVLSAGPHTPRGEAPVTKGPSPSGYPRAAAATALPTCGSATTSLGSTSEAGNNRDRRIVDVAAEP
jgi:hypothetical protein